MDADRLAQTVATLREFARRAGARRATALLDAGDEGGPVLVDCTPDGPVELEPDPGPLPAVADPLPLPPALRPAAPMRVDPATGRIDSRLGELERLAAGVRTLAGLLGGLSVATAEFATAEDGPAMTICARVGEPIVIALGERTFEAPEGWPG